MCESDYTASRVVACLTNIEWALHIMGRKVDKGVVVDVSVADRDALRCGADLCRSLAAADPDADLTVLNALRKHKVKIDAEMLLAIADACAQPYGRDLTMLAVDPRRITWCGHLRDLARPIREQDALETATETANASVSTMPSLAFGA
jgi:hypothetical protein